MIVESKPTEDLARFAVGLSYGDLPVSARTHARNLLLDSVACALAGDLGDETAMYTKYARAVGGAGTTTVIGTSEQLSELGACLINAYLITAVTVCDVYVPAHVHICPEIVPPTLAIAERDKADGKALLTSIALGSEVAVRVANALDYSVAGQRGWHMPGIVGPFGAAAAVGRLRGLTQLQMRNALGLAGSQAAGTWASWGTPAVKFHQSRGAVSGLLAGLLAEQDFSASAEIIAHPDGGLLAAYSNGGKPDALLEDIGKKFVFETISLRLWPGGTPLQPTLTAVFDLIAAEKPNFADIRRVRIDVAPVVYEAHARFAEPKNTFESLLSYPYTVSTALRDRRLWLTARGDKEIGDPELRRFMKEKVELVADANLTRERSRVEITMAGGKVLTMETHAAKGTPGNPVTLDDLRMKYDNCVAGRLSDAEASELFDLLVRVDELADLSRLFALLRAARTRGA